MTEIFKKLQEIGTTKILLESKVFQNYQFKVHSQGLLLYRKDKIN
jgi:hypothetical protein